MTLTLKERIVKNASDPKKGEICIFNGIGVHENELILFFGKTIVDQFNIQELLDVAIPGMYEYQKKTINKNHLKTTRADTNYLSRCELY